MRNFFWTGSPDVFVHKIRKYPASKGLPMNVLLILQNAPGHPESHEFNAKALKWSIVLILDTVDFIDKEN